MRFSAESMASKSTPSDFFADIKLIIGKNPAMIYMKHNPRF